ncbi:c-type cytochrome [Sulfitobacter sp.]|jgi:cytochrome c|uniref:c-type cytochrome n=1 Tax=Sulfitobacter sp. TaxID=1903071 RepID=UPI000C0FC86C|nr:cytochrome c family protein [Roseobacter sp.]MBV49787.1 cytochrome c family protein [Roseobacter sp.]PHR09353.1 MAG: cytochrome c family protein [Sulfitobacter sp.]
MFDTMTVTKIAAGLFGAWLILLLGKFAAEEVYQRGAHGEPGYVVEVASAEASAPAENAVDFTEVMASADPAAGEKVFRKCSACHKIVDGENAVGPYLHGVVGRKVDTAVGYNYSGALEKVVDVWTPENLSHFLEKPAAFAPGTKMGFAGLSKIEDRANVIAYLESLGN